MIFNVTHQNQKVKAGYDIAGMILSDMNFHDRIISVPKFTYTKSSPREVQAILFSNVQNILVHGASPIVVLEYYYQNSDVIATTFPKIPGKIFVNNNGVSWRSEERYSENGGHEFMHECGFGHGKTNFPPGSTLGWLRGDREDKTKSVPHLIGTMVVQFANDKRLV